MKHFYTLTLLAFLHFSAPVAAIDMPPLPEMRREVYETLYKLEFLEDGMPGRRTENGVVAHPIYPTYVIPNYLSEWRRTGDDVFLQAARTVANAALSRMEEFKGGLVYWYTEEMGLTGLPGKFYSGLTQSRYLEVLEMMAEATGEERYRQDAERVLRSLVIPVSEGGVARESHGGKVIEEWPHSMMSIYTLNGWATAMLLVARYAEASGSQPAKDFFDANAVALDALIQNFDHEPLANTRYGLAGFVYMRVLFPGSEGTVVRAQVSIPGEGDFPFTDEIDRTRWSNYFMDESTGRAVRMNAVLNYASAPDENVFKATVRVDAPRSAQIQIMGGDYVPTQTRQKNTDWVTIANVNLEAGETDLEIEIPWSEADLVAYPTAFTKVIGGINYNSYHFIHIRQVRQIAAFSGSEKLAAYADKWEAYLERWPLMPVYRDAPIFLGPYTLEPTPTVETSSD